MLLLIDNFDSFTHNLFQYFKMLGQDVRVVRNNRLTVAECADLRPSRIVISPGPGRPDDAGISKDLIRSLGPKIPILGVCLGLQCIAEVHKARVIKAPTVMHGKTSEIEHEGLGVFRGLPGRITATRYHSLIVDVDSLPSELEVTARTNDQIIMGLRHRDYPLEGVQFHPESILTLAGMQILSNFINN